MSTCPHRHARTGYPEKWRTAAGQRWDCVARTWSPRPDLREPPLTAISPYSLVLGCGSWRRGIVARTGGAVINASKSRIGEIACGTHGIATRCVNLLTDGE